MLWKSGISSSNPYGVALILVPDWKIQIYVIMEVRCRVLQSEVRRGSGYSEACMTRLNQVILKKRSRLVLLQGSSFIETLEKRMVWSSLYFGILFLL